MADNYASNFIIGDKKIWIKDRKTEDIANVVLDFGADNTGATDCTDAIQNALNSGKPYVYLPNGIYKTSKTLLMRSNTYLFGENATIESYNAESDPTIYNYSDGESGGYTAGENMVIDGLNIFSHNGQSIVLFCHCQNIKIINCYIQCLKEYCRGHHIEINSCQNALIDNNILKSIENKNEFIQLDVCTQYEVFPWYGPYDGTKLQYITISNNTLLHDKMPRPTEFDLGDTGIGNHNGDNTAQIRHIHIIGNYISRVRQGMKFKCFISGIIENNTIDFCQSGINHTSNSVIRDTIIANNYLYGNYSNNTSGLPENGVRGGGIRTGSELLTDTRNEIFGNIIKDFVGNGIWYVAGKDSVISNNTVVKCGMNGIYAGYSTERVTVNNNTCRNNGRYSNDTDKYYDLRITNMKRDDIASSGNNITNNNYCDSMIINEQDTADTMDYVYGNKCKSLAIGTITHISQWANETDVNRGLVYKVSNTIDVSAFTAKTWGSIGSVTVPESGVWMCYVELNMPANYVGNYTLLLRNGSTEIGRQSGYSDGTIQTRLAICVPATIDSTLNLLWYLENEVTGNPTYRYRLCKLPVNPNGTF